MADLTITSENLGVKFFDENNGSKITFNRFSIKRYANQNTLNVISHSKPSYADFKIIFGDYTDITFNGASQATMDILEATLENISL